ncbi:MAG: hypothetical protein H6718_14225 [Polyangiaceae bacterium]|nr:hypothetical protein [Myxococcales bacterium]MCB9586554.1 hypothetical protein [Polyangiaceae bacterium]MCB9606061.1 hypothetical protein [Polyangiaceae bacterium]
MSVRLAVLTRGLSVGALFFVALAAPGCGPDSVVETASVPQENDFSAVSEALEVRCGSLDCHGMAERNLRLYGQYGLRLSDSDIPGGNETTPDEHHENYLTLITLEPEALASVAQGAAASHLTLVRKARGVEDHKGGSPFPKGSAGDRCLVSWLAGQVDQASCTEASKLLEPP